MLEVLTATELEFVFMLAKGQNYKGVADWLGIDYKEYVRLKRAIFKKLNVSRMTELILIVWKEDLIENI